MEDRTAHEQNAPNNRFQTMLQCLTKCKNDYRSEKGDLIKIRSLNLKLESELKEARELEKLNRYHLLTSREMISNLQETVSQLLYLKRDVKRLNDGIASKDSSITLLEKEKDSMLQKHNETIEQLRNAHKQDVEQISTKWEQKAQQVQYECDTQIAQLTCVIEELRCKLKHMEAEHREKTNMLVLEYEEKIQRSVAQASQLQEQLARQAAHADANIDVYRRKLEETEEKLKQHRFKEYVAQSKVTTQYDNRGERPYSVDREPYADFSYVDYHPINRSDKVPTSQSSNTKTQKPPINTLQVMYQDNKNPQKTNEKKGQFNITKKRKLYNEKDFLNM